MASYGSYLAVIVGLETILFASVLVVVELQADPALQVIRRVAPFLNTHPGRAAEASSARAASVETKGASSTRVERGARRHNGELAAAVLVLLFLFGMGAFGIAMGVITFFLLVLNAYVITVHPESVADRQDPLPVGDELGGAQAPFHSGFEDDSPYAPKTTPSTADL